MNTIDIKIPNGFDKLICDGSCEEHTGIVRRVNVSDKGFDWGEFNYCETAIQEDINRGLNVKIIKL